MSTSCLWTIYCWKWTCGMATVLSVLLKILFFNSRKCGGEAKTLTNSINFINIVRFFQRIFASSASSDIRLQIVNGASVGLEKPSLLHMCWMAREMYVENPTFFWKVFEKKTNSPDVGSVFYFENLKIPLHTTVWPLLMYFGKLFIGKKHKLWKNNCTSAVLEASHRLVFMYLPVFPWIPVKRTRW